MFRSSREFIFYGLPVLSSSSDDSLIFFVTPSRAATDTHKHTHLLDR